MQNQLHSWTFPEYTNPDRNKKWYIWASIIFFFLLIYSILTANFLFGLIIIMVTILMFAYHHKKEETIEFSILNSGVQINNQVINFNEIKKFWIVYEPPAVKNLYFTTKSLVKPNIVIPLQNENPLKIRETLKKYLEEDLEQEGESTAEALERILKI